MPETLLIPPLKSFTIAIVLMIVGLNLGKRLAFVQRYSIPEPVVGGFLCAAVVGLVYWWAGVRIVFELPMLNTLLLYFFAAIGLNADIKTLRQGGKPMVLLLVLASVFIVLQNLLGMGMASLFGQPHQAGLMTGSVSLTGGVGTTLAWAPTFVSQLGIGNAAELGMASNMVGLIAACLVGGPIASYLLRRHHITDSHAQPLDVGVSAKLTQAPLDYFGVLRAWLWLNVALILGDFITPVFQALGLRLPSFVGCLMAGIVLRNSIGLWLPLGPATLANHASRSGLDLRPVPGPVSHHGLDGPAAMGAARLAGVCGHGLGVADTAGRGLQHLGGLPFYWQRL